MNTSSLLGPAWLLAVSIVMTSLPLCAQSFGQLKIYTAVELQFQTETGKMYQLQGSSNLVDWTAVDQPQCGTGSSVSRLYPAQSGGTLAWNFYRLQVVETNCSLAQPRGLLLLGQSEHLTVAANLLGVVGLTPRQNTIPDPDEAVLFTVSLKDGPMPQTREQIMAIQGKQHGPAAIFLVDSFLVEDPDLRSLVSVETRDLLKTYQQPGVDVMPVFYDDQPNILDEVRELIAHGAPP